MTTVAMIGLGRMGRPMSTHLLRHGFAVIGYDVAPDALRWADEHGLGRAGSPAEAAAAAEFVIVMTSNEGQVRDAVLGEDGAFRSVRSRGSGGTAMIGSTVSPELVRELSQHGAELGWSVVDAPCARGERGAVEGNLLWLVGGQADDVERCRPVMEACGQDVFHLGPVGAGQVGKAVNNMLLWAALCADHEALDLAERYGVDRVGLRQALTRSSASNWALEHWDDMGNIPWAVKDMDIALDMASAADVELPVAALVRQRVGRHVREAGWDNGVRVLPGTGA